MTTSSHKIPSKEGIQIFTTSFAQQRLWILDRLEPESANYNIHATVRLRQRIDVERLEQSINSIVARHEVLRTTFRMMKGQLVQVIAATLTVSLQKIDLQRLPETEREIEALRLVTEEVLCPFDLARGPLVRATLLQMGIDDCILLLTMHQIVFDSRSMQVFLQELAIQYESFSIGRSSPLPDLSMQYADFAVWQRESLQGDILAEHLNYWKRQLAAIPAGLDLPTDRPHLPVPTSRGATYDVTLSQYLTDALKDLSCQEGVSLYTILVATFQILLYRYTGQDDLVIGTVAPGRTRAETRPLIGLFENLLALRTNLSANPTFRELLGRVQEVILGAQEHQDLPFEFLLKELQPERRLGLNPLFQVAVILEPPLPNLPLDWMQTQMKIEPGVSKFDLTLKIENRREGLVGRFEYRTDLFEQTTVARMAGHWQTLLEGIVTDPTQHLAELPLLTKEERYQLLMEWNATQASYPKDKCVHQLFEAQVERTPQATAVLFEDEHVTYRELNRRANQLAYYLQQLGVGPDVLVGICVDRSLDMMIGLLGILKAGGAYVPLDPGFPTERIAFMLEDSGVSVLVTQQHLIAQLPQHRAKVVCLDTDRTVLAQQSDANLLATATSANLAYVIYTSGSTGRPKGVQIIHRAVVNFLLSMREQPGLTSEDTLLAITTLCFDIAALELFLPLIVGARVVVASRAVITDGTALIHILDRKHITVMQATPVTWRILLAASWQGKRDLKILCGGEALPLHLARQLLPKAASLWNLYGPTETTIWSSACKIDLSKELITIGRPIANTQLYLLNEYLHLVPVGVQGELYIGGDGLARGYLSRPELTAERFVHNPFSDDPDARLYKTGDLARYCSDGTIEHLGRLDFQVKLRGFRIELGEIEAVLSRHPAVRQAVVVAREEGADNKRLVAYAHTPLQKQEVPLLVPQLRTLLKEQLPDYMIPASFVILQALPLTPNGKVDRKALPVPEPGRSTTMDTFVAPTLPLHHQLIQIWEELLDVQSIGIRDDFFDLGGNSFLAIRLFDRIAQVCGKKLAFSTLFTGATIEYLATALIGETKTDSRTPLVVVQASGSRRPFFFLHGEWAGGAFYSRELARYLGPDQPFYLLEPYKFDDLSVPPSFETMAAVHVKALRSVQPEGPYLLGGWCNGGLIAYEMARQLQAQGQQVDLLVLMDPDSPAPWKWGRRIISGLANLLRLRAEKQVDWFLTYRYLRLSFHYWRLNKLKHIRTVKRSATEIERSKVDTTLTQRMPLFPGKEVLRQDWLSIYDWVSSGYMPHSYPGKITFFWTDEEPHRKEKWHKSLGSKLEGNRLEEHIVPGNHMTGRIEYLPVLAEKLAACVKQYSCIH